MSGIPTPWWIRIVRAQSTVLGVDTLEHRSTSLPGRSIIDLVNSQPGWLLESNGVLHPRGSEYQTQYVVDGVPLTDNRSPSFAPEIEADDARIDDHPYREFSRRVWKKTWRRG